MCFQFTKMRLQFANLRLQRHPVFMRGCATSCKCGAGSERHTKIVEVEVEVEVEVSFWVACDERTGETMNFPNGLPLTS
jgi:hypothetical protein